MPIRINSHMHILWLSWRDIKNPESGGAEKVAIEVASRFVRDGTNVTIFTSSFKDAKSHEILRKVKIIRQGNHLTCRLFAFFYYLKNQKHIDLVIDEINTIPFLTPFYARKKSVVLIHQLAKEYWWAETFFPLNLIGYLAEPIYLRFYQDLPTITISNSTKKDLDKLRFRNIQIVRKGLDFKPQLTEKKANVIIFIGRLTRAKRPQDAILAFKEINNLMPDTKLIIVGKGKRKFVNSLKKLIATLNLDSCVKFAGFVSESVKINLLKRAKIILIPSIREGWCLAATEANALGCVPVAYNVPGLKDSIKNGINGVLVKSKPQNLAQAAVKLLTNEIIRAKFAENGYNWSRQFSWKKCYLDSKHYIYKVYAQKTLQVTRK